MSDVTRSEHVCSSASSAATCSSFAQHPCDPSSSNSQHAFQGTLKADAATLARACTLAAAPLDTLQSALTQQASLTGMMSYSATPHLRELLRVLTRARSTRPQAPQRALNCDADVAASGALLTPAAAPQTPAAASAVEELSEREDALYAAAETGVSLLTERPVQEADADQVAQAAANRAQRPRLEGAQAIGQQVLDWEEIGPVPNEESTQV